MADQNKTIQVTLPT